jgi:hypothetical protein
MPRHLITLTLLWLASCVGWASVAHAEWRAEAPRHPEPSADEWRRLLDGEVLVEGRSAPGPEGEVTVQAVFLGTAEEPWRLLGDCGANFRFVPGLQDCRLLAESRTAALTRFVHKAAWFLPRAEFTFETVRQPRQWIRVRLAEGDLQAMEGSWRFDPLVQGGIDAMPRLLVTHRMRVRPGTPAPRWLVRRTMQRDAVDLLGCLRWLAGASPGGAQADRDRSSCQAPTEA